MTRLFLLAILIFSLLCISVPAAAMPQQLITDDNAPAKWNVEEQTGTVHIIPLEDGVVRIRVEDGGKVRLTKEIDLTGVDHITFRITNFDYGRQKCSSERFTFSIDDTRYSRTQYNLESDWNVNTSSLNGYHTLEFMVRSPQLDSQYYAPTGLEIRNFSVIAYTSPPQPQSIILNTDVIKSTEKASARITFTQGDRPETDELVIDWGDGSIISYSTTGISSPLKPIHTYSAGGTYTITCKGHNRDGGDTSNPIQTQIHVISASISATPQYTNPNTPVSFSAGVTNSDTVIWNFGDGSPTRTEIAPQHTYTKPGTYTVTVTVKNLAGKSVIYNETVGIIAEFIRWDKESYDPGETAVITWTLLPPDQTTTYQIYVFPADERGEPAMDANPVWHLGNITQTGSINVKLDAPSGFGSGRYVACVIVNGQTTSVQQSILITGAAAHQSGVSSPTPSMQTAAEGDTYVTFRVIDKDTGHPISGANLTAIGKKATNPIAVIGQAIGQAWGESITGTARTGITDVNGAVTFAMSRNLRYEITANYREITESFAYQPSTTETDHLIRLNIQKATPKNPAKTVITSINTEPDAIIVNYEDTTQTTKELSILIEEQKPGEKGIYISNRKIRASKTIERFNLIEPAGKSYRITLTAESAVYGSITRTYAATFPGPLVKIGIPDSLYLYLVIFLLFTFGAIGTHTTAPIVGICVCFLGWIFYFFGWLFALGSLAPIALGFATIIALFYYIRTRLNEGRG